MAFVLTCESGSDKIQYDSSGTTNGDCRSSFLSSISLLLLYFFCFIDGKKILFSFLLFVWLLVDFVKVWRFGFEFERWDFVMVFGLILACVHSGSVGWVMVMVVVRLLFFG